MAWTDPALIFSCSPRAGGNSDAAARALAGGLASAGGLSEIITLRRYPLAGCTGCGACDRDPARRCVLPDAAAAHGLFERILAAPLVCFTAPIYFYHLPALFKAFIDRSQPYYYRWAAGEPLLNPPEPRPALAVLVAGRPAGERLFEGSLLTLRYFVKLFGFKLTESVAFRGKDAAGDLTADIAAQHAIRALARRAWLGDAAGS